MYNEHFSLANIPFGVASSASHQTRSVAVRYEDTVIFLDKLVECGILNSVSKETQSVLCQSTVNAFAALPKAERSEARSAMQAAIASKAVPAECTSSIEDVTMHLPVKVEAFTDFSCSKEHVLNAGEAVFNKREMPPGFLHFPVGYTGRASSIVVSGTPITRPHGQFRSNGDIIFGPSQAVDYELEVGCVIGKPSKLGDRVSLEDADDHIFGLVLINDWSARDIQGLEMNPFGPTNGKSFGTSMSPWIITLEALEAFETQSPAKELSPATYLQDLKVKNTYDVHLKAELVASDKSVTTICQSELKAMYWSFRDLVAHQTVNGCNINTGDILATGTISGNTEESHGCLLEVTRGGKLSFKLANGEKRTYLEDGDVVRISAIAGKGVGFGDCYGELLPARM